MKTSQEWWDETKNDPEKLHAWLQKQYTGEVTAATRIMEFRDKFASNNPKASKSLEYIAGQERKHAKWIGELLNNRGYQPVIAEPHKRYWKEALPGIADFETGSAVAAHAEKMRLDRIRVIANDKTAPHDIVEVFRKILPEEEFHERRFRAMSTPEAMQATLANHEAGAASLGLVV